MQGHSEREDNRRFSSWLRDIEWQAYKYEQDLKPEPIQDVAYRFGLSHDDAVFLGKLEKAFK